MSTLITIFIYLLLSHLLADFVFQPEALISWKHHSPKGVLLHSAIHFFFMVLFFWPMAITMNLPALLVFFILSGVHYLIDAEKIKTEHVDNRYVRIFFRDQFYHFLFLLIGTLLLGYLNPFPQEYVRYFVYFLPFAIYFSISLLGTYVYEIVLFQFTRRKESGNAIKFNYPKMLLHLIGISVCFWLYLYLFALGGIKNIF